MAGHSIGTVFVELDMDASRYVKSQQKLYKDATSTSLSIEENFKKLGIKSSAEFDLMRQKASNAYEMIKHSAQATANDIVRAEKAKADQLTRINELQFGKQRSLVDQMKGHWLAATAAVYASMRLLGTGWSMMDNAAKAEQQAKSFDRLAASYGAGGQQILDGLKKVSGETINTMTLIEKAGTAMMMGIAPDKVSQLMEIARATSRQTGQDVGQAFSDIALAVGRQSKMILDNLGIIVSVEKANQDYARSLGKTADSMTDAEKKAAFLNATISAGRDIMERMGEQMDTDRDRMERYKASVSDLEISIGKLGLAFTPLINILADATQGLNLLIDTSEKGKLIREQMSVLEEIANLEKNIASQSGLFSVSNWINGLFGNDVKGDNNARLQELQDRLQEIGRLLNAPPFSGTAGPGTQAPIIDVAEQKKVLEQFEKEFLRSQKGITATEIAELEKRVAKYQQYGADEVRLEEMKQAELKDIMIRANNEKMALYEDLYEATGMERYAQEAIAAYREIMDADEQKWATILGNADDAHTLRLSKEEEYAYKVYGIFDDIVEAEARAADERIDITRDMVDEKIAMEERMSEIERSLAGTSLASTQGSSAGVPIYTGGAGYPMLANWYKQAQVDAAWAENARLTAESMQEVAKNTRELVDYSASAEQRDLERQQREREQAYQQFWQNQGQLSESLFATATSIADAMAGLYGGSMVPVQSAEFYGARYQGLYEAAHGDQGRLQEMLSFVNEYLGFFSGYGGNYSAIFQSVVDDLETLKSHYETMGWLSDIGLGDTASDLNLLVTAFNNLGTSAEQLRISAQSIVFDDVVAGFGALNLSVSDMLAMTGAVDLSTLIGGFADLGISTNTLIAAFESASAKGTGLEGALAELGLTTDDLIAAAKEAAGAQGVHGLGQELTGTKTPFQNVIDALSTMTGDTKTKLTSAAEMWQAMVTGISGSMANITSGITAAYQNAQTHPVIQYQSTIVPVPWSLETQWGTNLKRWVAIYGTATVGTTPWGTSANIAPPKPSSDYQHVVYGPAGAGAFTKGLTLAGEIGPEWIVPTYEPQKSRFLRDVGADPDAIGEAIAKRLGPLMSKADSGEIHVHVHIEEKELGYAIARQTKTNPDLQRSIKRLS